MTPEQEDRLLDKLDEIKTEVLKSRQDNTDEHSKIFGGVNHIQTLTDQLQVFIDTIGSLGKLGGWVRNAAIIILLAAVVLGIDLGFLMGLGME